MPDEPRSDRELRDDLLRRLDPGGEMSEMMEAFAALADSRLARGLLGLAGIAPADVDEPLTQARQLLGNLTDAALIFAPLGWALSSQTPADLYAEALDSYRQSGSVDEAERCLVKGWNDKDRLRFYINHLKGLGAGHEPLQRISMRRWELVARALKHHDAGAYEASVPIVLAQADGIVWDLTDPPRGLFTGRARQHLVDDGTVAGVPEGLAPLSLLFSENIKESGITGKLSRHGILHGRELGYDTLINSTKVFVMLLAVVEWAQPLARVLAERLYKQREEQFAGSDETDEDGKRRDTRGFDEAKKSLHWLGVIQMGQWRNHDRYGDDLEAMAPGSLGDKMLHDKSKIHLSISDNRREYSAWRSTPSGWCFGIAGRGGPPNEQLYAGMGPPPDDLEADEWSGWPIDW